MKKSLALFITAFLTASAFGQMKETVTVSLVEVPVTVIDGNGNPVRGLSAKNFALFDNGVERSITAFDKIDFASGGANALSPLPPAARRQFLLLFDLSNSGPKALTRARAAAAQFIEDNVQPRDLVGVGSFDVDHGFHLLAAFTTDRQLVVEAMENPAKFEGSDPLQIAANPATFETEQKTPESGSAAMTAQQSWRASMQEMARQEMADTAARGEAVNEQFTRQRVDRMVEGLGQIASLFRSVPGRKQIVLLTEGFDPKYLQGRDAQAAQQNASDSEAAVHGQVWNVDQDQRYGNAASQGILGQMAQYFRQSDVVLQAIDIQGVRLQEDIQHGATINSNAGLFLLAHPTGGEVFENANDLKSDFQKMIHQQEVVYVLGFQAPPDKPGSFHNIKVKLIDVPNARVSYREGYFEPGSETPQQRILSNAEVIVNDIPQSGLRVRALSAAFPASNGVAQVPVILEINGKDLAQGTGGGAAHLQIYIYAFDADGLVRDRLNQDVTLDLEKVGNKLLAGGMKYYGTLLLPPGKYAVKSLVQSADNDRRGYTRTDLVVPQLNDVAAVQAVPIDEMPRGVLVRGDSHAPDARYPFVLNGQDFIPTAAVRNDGSPQKIALFVYGAPTQSLTWQTVPKTTFLGRADGLGLNALVLQIDPTNAKSLDITVHKNGMQEARKLSVPIVE